MEASEVMTRHVVTVAPETPLRAVAHVLLERGISAAPVVGPSGEVLGMVSEGDLIGRDDAEREGRRDWWLALLAEGEALNPDFLAHIRSDGRTARDVMSAPVVTVAENTTCRAIARLLADYHIKRVPVLREGRIVGIVSRADLLRGFAAEHLPAAEAPHRTLLGRALTGLDERFRHGQHAAGAGAPAAAAQADGPLTVDHFKALVADFRHRQSERGDEARRARAANDRDAVRRLIDRHVGEGGWNALLHAAREAAEQGAKEALLLRFPSELCSDGGRAINAPLPDWPKTLRGEAAELYLRWERDLRPHGFHLAARVLAFPGGKPGDIGLFLVWGD